MINVSQLRCVFFLPKIKKFLEKNHVQKTLCRAKDRWTALNHKFNNIDDKKNYVTNENF